MYWIRLDSVVLGKALAAERVNLKQNPNRQKLRAPPVTFSGTMHTIYHFVNKFPVAAPLPTPQNPLDYYNHSSAPSSVINLCHE